MLLRDTLNRIHIAIHFHPDIPYGYLFMVRTR